MNRMPLLVFGVFLSFAFAWLGLVAYPYVTLGRLQPVVDENTGDISPPPLSGLAVAGQAVYAANGCVNCHSQTVRPRYLSTDIAKSPKTDPPIRRTVARDYLRSQPAFVGLLRIGPDLANFGLKAPAPTANAIHRQLYEPRTITHHSIMPAYRFLYTLRKISGQPSNDAITGLTGPYAPAPGYEVVPTEDAKTLVAYLLSLKRNDPLPEASLIDGSKFGAGAGGPAASVDPMVAGKRVFKRTCAVCHRADGMGVPGQFPPLAGSEWVLSQGWHGDNHIVGIVLDGLHGVVTVKGRNFNNMMTPWAGVLDDSEIAAVLTYIRNSWGNQAPPIPESFVAKIREKNKDRSKPWTQKELMTIERELVGDAEAAPDVKMPGAPIPEAPARSATPVP